MNCHRDFLLLKNIILILLFIYTNVKNRILTDVNKNVLITVLK